MNNSEEIKLIEIDGVVAQGGIHFHRPNSAEDWQVVFNLLSWRRDGSPVSSSVFRLSQSYADLQSVQDLSKQIQPCRPVKLLVSDVVKMGATSRGGRRRGTFQKFVGESNDEFILGIAANLEKPQYFHDDILGEFLRSSYLGSYRTVVFWKNRAIHLTLGGGDDGVFSEPLAVGHHLVRHADEWAEKWRSFALENIYDPTSDWYAEDVEWTPELFLKELGHPSISSDEGDAFICYFDGKRLFGDHCVVVGASIQEGFKDWSLAG